MSDGDQRVPTSGASPAAPPAEGTRSGPSSWTNNEGGNATGGSAEAKIRTYWSSLHLSEAEHSANRGAQVANLQAFIQNVTTNNIHLGTFLTDILSLNDKPLKIEEARSASERARVEELLEETGRLKELALTVPPFKEVHAEWTILTKEKDAVKEQGEKFKTLLKVFEKRNEQNLDRLKAQEREVDRYQETIREHRKTINDMIADFEEQRKEELMVRDALKDYIKSKDEEIKKLNGELAKFDVRTERGGSISKESSTEHLEWRDKVKKWIESSAEAQKCVDNLRDWRKRKDDDEEGARDKLANAETAVDEAKINLKKCEEHLRGLHKRFCEGSGKKPDPAITGPFIYKSDSLRQRIRRRVISCPYELKISSSCERR
jgi:chromosome segregation ATPase